MRSIFFLSYNNSTKKNTYIKKKFKKEKCRSGSRKKNKTRDGISEKVQTSSFKKCFIPVFKQDFSSQNSKNLLQSLEKKI